jgi:prepilin-type N-terminal cleavage/methylation domain-containing protein
LFGSGEAPGSYRLSKGLDAAFREEGSGASMGSGRRAGGFTLIELLVVIIIIGILAAITLVVGQGVVQGQRSRLTADTIRVVDIGIDAYFRDVGGPPPVLVEAPNPEPGFATDPTQTVLLPMADATDWTDGASENEKATINSMGVFLEAASQAGLGELVQSVSPDLVTFFDGDDPDNNYSPAGCSAAW